jgi:hypothetical protein
MKKTRSKKSLDTVPLTYRKAISKKKTSPNFCNVKYAKKTPYTANSLGIYTVGSFLYGEAVYFFLADDDLQQRE